MLSFIPLHMLSGMKIFQKHDDNNILYYFVSDRERMTDGGTYLKPCQTSKMKYFAKMVNGFLPLIILQKAHLRFLLGVDERRGIFDGQKQSPGGVL